MLGSAIFQISLFLFIVTILAIVLGEYMAKVFVGERTLLSPILVPIENFFYKLFGINPEEEMNWQRFAWNVVIFGCIGILVLFLLQKIQYFLPLNPQKFRTVKWDTALNTAISFVTNTNWQAYKPESTLSYLTQMLGMSLQNFLSAATGMAVTVAVIQAFIRKNSETIGNFWVYLTRSILYILLPLAIILSLILISQGTIQNFNPYTHVVTLEGKEQVIAQGPAASQIAIKHLGTNGGGFFTANSAHPYENPTPLSDYLEVLSLIIIAAAFPFAFGALLNNRKQGWAIFIAMLLLFAIGVGVSSWAELHGNPAIEKMGVIHGNNMEGKEMRIGTLSSVVFADATTATATGAVNSAHDSFMPLATIVQIFNMAIGEVIFGGVGSGMIGILLYAILSMFLVGLMIGHSPELYGKKLEPTEMIMTCIALISPCVLQLILSAIAAGSNSVITNLGNPGSHGLTEIIYTFASATGNNGSALSGVNTNVPFFNIATGIAMLIGRYITLLPAIVIAGSLAKKKIIPPVSRFPTASPIFILTLIGTIILLGALTFFPVLVLGPILEQLQIK